MASVYDWDATTPGNNATQGSINFAENQSPSTVNNSARQMMSDISAWVEFLGGAKISSGTDTVTLTSGLSLTAYEQSQLFAFEAGGTNTGAVTLNVDSIGAKSVVKHRNHALVANDIEAGGIYVVAYEATADNFQLLSPVSNEPSSTPTTTRGDIIRRGASADERVPLGADNTIFASDGTDPNYETLTSLLDSAIGNTQGNVLYRSGSAWSVLAPGTSGQVLQTQGAGANPQWANAAGLTLGTEQATTSGTSVTFSSIPSGTKMIIVMFVGVSFSAGAEAEVLLGDSGGIETSGYVGVDWDSTAGTDSGNTDDFMVHVATNGNDLISGTVILTLEDSSDHTWTAMWCMASTNQPTSSSGSGRKSLSGELTQIRIEGGTFDAGAVNISYM